MGRRVSIDGLADAVMQELDNYADTTADGVKAAVKKAANTVKKEITAGLVRFEQAIMKDLLLEAEQDQYFPKFNVDGLLRGDYASRMQGYATGISNGFLSPNDIRRLENMNLIPAEKGGDDYYLNGGYVKLQDAGKQVKADPAAEDTRRKK